LHSQKYKDNRDWSLKDSIHVNNDASKNERELHIRNTLRLSNEYVGTNNLTNHWNDYRNLTLVEYGVFINKFPVYVTLGNERGSQFNHSFNQIIGSVKIDFVQYLQSLKQDLNLNQSIDQLNYENADEILKEELKKSIKKDLHNRFSMDQIDSLQHILESMRSFEQKLNNPLERESIKQRKTILKEFSLGNKLEGFNYDSLQKIQIKFDQDQKNYESNSKIGAVKDYRRIYESTLSNKDKAMDLKNRTEGKNKRLQERFKVRDFLNTSRLKVNKFNIGQSSIDNSELVFRGFMVNGLNMEVKSPFYFQFIYSVPFQTNLFTNYKLNSIQNNQVQTTGLALGISPEAKFNSQISIYQFKESSGYYRFRQKDSSRNGLQNTVLLSTTVMKFNQQFTAKIELAKSETNSREFLSLKDLSSTSAIKISNEINLFKKRTAIKMEIQSVGLGYYSSANPFVQRGKGGLLSIEHKISSQFNFKAKTSYRYSEDSNRLNTNFSSYGILKYKMSRYTSFELRAMYFKTNLNFKVYNSSMSNELYSLTWMQKMKKGTSIHNLMSSLQFSRTFAKSSEELNNSGNQQNCILNSTYTYTRSKFNLNANLEESYNLDSMVHGISNGLMLGFALAEKTQIGGGATSLFSNSALRQFGFNINAVTTLFKKLSVSASIAFSIDHFYNQTTISPQFRTVYMVF
jgi:hypothetical protein